MRLFANIISVVFHPLFVPFWIFVYAIQFDLVLSMYFNGAILLWSLLFLILNLVIGPGLSMLYLKKKGNIDSLTMPSLKGRPTAYAIATAYHIWNAYLFTSKGIPRIMEGMLIGVIIVLILLTLISFKWKISAHMTAMGGFLAIICWMMMFYGQMDLVKLSIGLLCLGLVGTARLILDAHNQAQLWAGAALGFTVVITTMIYYV